MTHFSKMLLTSASTALILIGCSSSSSMAKMESKVEKKEILTSYANLALSNYQDALRDAKLLQKGIYQFADKPNKRRFEEAKALWLLSRESYGQSEIFRLSNGPIDAEEGWIADSYGALEGQINAWPLDEQMIDYTINENGKRTRGNIIDTIGKFNPGGEDSRPIDVRNITKEVLTELNENGGEANVATGYHAIEFLLWGQDQDYNSFIEDKVTRGNLKAGNRKLRDFTKDRHAKRRLAYLKASADKLVEDLEIIVDAWSMEMSSDCSKDAIGCYRGAFLGELKGKDASKNIDQDVALRQIFSGMGVFIKSELANERIAVAVLTPSEEDEHSCFSDNTHRDIATNYQGFKNVLMSSYNGKNFGASAFKNLDKESQSNIITLMGSIEVKIAKIDAIAQVSRHFDKQIYPNDPQAKEIVKLKNELRKLGDVMVGVARQNGVSLSVDDVTDPEETKL